MKMNFVDIAEQEFDTTELLYEDIYISHSGSMKVRILMKMYILIKIDPFQIHFRCILLRMAFLYL